MPPTIREQILQAFVAALQGTAQVGTRIYRSRVAALARGESPALVVEPLRDVPTNNVLPKLDWAFQAQVAIIVRGMAPDQLADPIVDDVHKRLISNAPLNALLTGLQPGPVAWLLVDGDQDAGVITLDYEVRYRTSFADLSLS
jgi:hypothetical protein